MTRSTPSHRRGSAPNEFHIGFISVVELGNDSVIGGYLILNALARPVEFHCTEPVKPNRAQQILYGHTLRPFLCGDQVGMALVNHTSTRPDLICTDVPDVAALRPLVDIPLMVLSEGNGGADRQLERHHLGGTEIFIHHQFPEDAEISRQIVEQHLQDWDLTEPFLRIHEAVSEIRKAA